MTQSVPRNSLDQARFSLILPISRQGTASTTNIDSEGVVVVVGANGSGKSRLGVWLELDGPQKYSVYRISAQRSLKIPSSTSVGSFQEAQKKLLYGEGSEQVLNNIEYYRRNGRWQQEPVTHQLNDYEALLQMLFAENYDQLLAVNSAALASGNSLPAVETKLTKAKALWEHVLPQRELILYAGRIEARSRTSGTTSYNAAQMSDGERVIFYLIGQCLAAAANSVLIIDEPEVHVHKALQAPLWDALQAARPDCLFVYMTHDLDFAATRIGAPRIWLKSYEPQQGWEWTLLASSDEMPDSLLLTLVGSRKPILFVEGEKGNLDDFLFSILYARYTIIPRGGSDSVIGSARVFASLRELHHIESYGIVDRDYRDEDDVRSLERIGINVIGVSEIENLFLLEDVLVSVASYIGFDPPRAPVESIKQAVFTRIQTDREKLSSNFVRYYIEAKLLNIPKTAVGGAQIKQSLESMLGSIDAQQLYDDKLRSIDSIIQSNGYEDALRIYNNKGLFSELVPRHLGISKERFLAVLKLLLGKPEGASALATLRRFTPVLP